MPKSIFGVPKINFEPPTPDDPYAATEHSFLQPSPQKPGKGGAPAGLDSHRSPGFKDLSLIDYPQSSQRASLPGQEQDSKFLMELLATDFQATENHRQELLKDDYYVKLKIQ